MKKLLFSLILLLVSYVGFSQKGLSYQAVILDPNAIEVPGQDITGQPFVNGDVWMKFSIYNGSTLQFEEVQKTKTDAYGLVNLMIGSVSTASFNSLTWDGVQKSMQVFVSFNQGTSYTKVSDQKLNYNPYALYAETAGKLGSVLSIAGGGTGATTAADARVNLGLGNVDNTSDAAKPISTATNAALALKANSTDVNAALALKANTSDMTAALAAKADTGTIKTFVVTQVAAATIADADASTKGKIQLAGDLAGTADTPTVPGLALKANISSLSAVATSGNYNDLTNKPTLPKASATELGGIKVGANLSIDANGVLSAAGGSNASSISGVVPIANGGTGTTTIAGIKSVLGFSSSKIAIGDQAGQTGQQNYTIALGAGAGASNQISGAIAIGGAAGGANQGSASVAIGSNAGQANQSQRTVAVGFAAGQNNQGENAVALGTFAGNNGQVANSIAINATGMSTPLNPTNAGFYVDPIRNVSTSTSLFYNSTTKEITYGTAAATGAINLASGVTGTLPIANGGTGQTTLAGVKSLVGLLGNKIAVGSDAGLTSQGNDAVALGAAAGRATQGTQSVAIGYNTGATNQGPYAVSVGTVAGQAGQGANAVAIGFAAGQNNQAEKSVAIGAYAASGHINSSAIGYQAVTTSPNTIQLGADGVTVSGSTAITNVRTSGSLTAGAVTYPNTNGTAGQVLTANNNGNASWTTIASGGGDASSLTGTLAIANGGTGSSTKNFVDLSTNQTIGGVKIFSSDLNLNGATIGRGNSNLDHNNVHGYAALGATTTGNYNNAFGFQALTANTSGQENSALGEYVLPKNTTGNFNTAMGTAALRENTTGSSNTGFGYHALLANSTGSNNTALGSDANVGSTNLTNATAIGYGAIVSTSNTIQLGNTSVTDVKTSGAITAPIYASTPQALTDGSIINWNPTLGLNASVTLGGNRTLSFTANPTPGSYGTIVVTQDGIGNRTITLPSTANKVLGSTSTTTIALSSAANAKDILNFYYDGTDCYWNIGQGYGIASSSSSTANLATGVTGTLSVANGGTGATTLTGYIKGTGTTSMTASATIPVADVTGAAPLVSPAFTGTPSLPTGTIGVTQTAGNNTTALATTAFVTTAVAAAATTVRLNSDEFTATSAQTSFTLTQTALGAKVFMFINGTRIKGSAYTVSGTTVTYTASNNNSYALVAGDRIQFDYAY